MLRERSRPSSDSSMADHIMHRRPSKTRNSRLSMTEVESPPIGAWPLNNDTRLQDISGNGNHGEAELLGEFRSGPGKNVSSYEILSDANSITIPNTNRNLSFKNDFTVAFWIYSYESEDPGEYFGSIGCFSPLIDWYTDPQGIDKFTWGIHAWIFNGKMAVDLAYNDNAQLETSFPVDQNRWTLCGFSFQWSQKILTMWVGSRKVKRRLSSNDLKTNGTVHIGRRFPESYGQDLKGRICRLVMWDCLLTSGQVEEHMPLIFDVYAEQQKGKLQNLRKSTMSLAASTSTLAEGWEKDLECPVCYERLISPKTLPCQHSFCLDCLSPLAGHKARVTCPICREPHLIPVGGVENFPTIPIVETLLTAVDVLSNEAAIKQQTQMQTEAKCFECHQMQLLTCCPHCDFPVCTECRDKHLETVKKVVEETVAAYEKHSVAQYAAHVKVAHNKSELESQVKLVNEEIEQVADEKIKRFGKAVKREKEALLEEVTSTVMPKLQKISKIHDTMSSGMDKTNKILKQGEYDLRAITEADGQTMKKINEYWDKLQQEAASLPSDFPDADIQPVKVSFKPDNSAEQFKPALGKLEFS